MQDLGFRAEDIIRIENADKADFDAAKKMLFQRIGGLSGAIIFVFFGGHGYDGSFIASDGDLVGVEAYFLDFIDLHKSAVAGRFSSKKACQSRIVVVQDCCQVVVPGGTLFGPMKPGLPLKTQGEICYICATRRGALAGDGALIDALLRGLDVPGLSLVELFQRMHDECQSSLQRPCMQILGSSVHQIVWNRGPMSVVSTQASSAVVDRG